MPLLPEQALLADGSVVPLTEGAKAAILEKVDAMARDALRCLALAVKTELGEFAGYDGAVSHPVRAARLHGNPKEALRCGRMISREKALLPRRNTKEKRGRRERKEREEELRKPAAQSLLSFATSRLLCSPDAACMLRCILLHLTLLGNLS
jgi:hypothetical protein